MPIPTIETHNIIAQRSTADLETPKGKKTTEVDFSTPETQLSASDFSITSSSGCSSDSVSSEEESTHQELSSKESEAHTRSVVVTEHKIAELEGKHQPEPLLQENPARFVLFPIRNTEVR